MIARNTHTPHERTHRKSTSREIGLEPVEPLSSPSTLSSSSSATQRRPSLGVRFRSTNSIINSRFEPTEPMADSDWEDVEDEDETALDVAPLTTRQTRPCIKVLETPFYQSYRLLAIVSALLLLVAQHTLSTPEAQRPILGASAAAFVKPDSEISSLSKRANSPTDVCKRWAQQSALVNGTLYLYGGNSMNASGQTQNTWNNNLLALDLTKTWSRTSPALSGLPQPAGPPAVAQGALWSSYDSLFLYGGYFSDKPVQLPVSFSLWEYNIASSSWKEHADPKTSGGVNAEAAGESIERAAEGAGFSMASIGKGWYFGGHLDFLTTKGWSIQTPRLYLKSFVEYTFPGYKTPEGKIAGSEGEWRNITSGGTQDSAGFTERADGILVYIPGFGDQGVLLSLAGGTNVSFTQMNQVDVFDIASSTWYRQATSGSTPKIRVNPCAVTAAAIDGSSYNIYMFGGQNLLPYGEQIQYNDMWILSIPSFTWIQVDMKGQSIPDGRSGHTCNIWDGQMIMVGGYVGQDISCDSPGTYVFNLSSLSWENQFTSLSNVKTNPFSQHPNQHATNASAGLPGSFGYLVPDPVVKAVGGSPTGGATVTKPIMTATAGPLASGKPQTYPGLAPAQPEKTSHGARIGAIVAGSVAGVLLLLTLYLGFCAFVYRRQLKLYREHIAMTQRSQSHPSSFGEKAGAMDLPTGLTAALAASPGSWSRGSGAGSAAASSAGSQHRDTAYNPHESLGGQSYNPLLGRRSDEAEYDEDVDLMGGLEPTFVGVMLHPRRSLRVINRD